jgi:transcriptional regulator GlxA family with amidase domain
MDMRDFEVIVIAGAYPSSVVMSRDILDAAAQLAAGVGAPVPRWGLYSLDGGRVELRDGISVMTAKLPPRRRGNRSICLVPGLGAEPNALLARMRDPDCAALARRLATHVRHGGEVASSCSAVFLLDAAGLLAGRRATTTWWLAPVLARELCVSQKTLARHVRKATGKGTGEFVRSLRLRRARALLQDSRMTIDQVAAAVGYQDATALRRLMRQSTGASPSHFRQAATVAG